LIAKIERNQAKYKKQLHGKTNQSNKQRDWAIVLQKELDEAKNDLDLLKGENANLQETIKVMEKNLATMHANFLSRTKTARKERFAQKEEYKEQLEHLKNESDVKKKELREVSHQNDVAKDTVRMLKQDLEVKAMIINKAKMEQQLARELYEGRINCMRAELQNSKEEQMKTIGEIMEEYETMKKELDKERKQKHLAEYHMHRL
jgi:hypothetical protein